MTYKKTRNTTSSPIYRWGEKLQINFKIYFANKICLVTYFKTLNLTNKGGPEKNLGLFIYCEPQANEVVALNSKRERDTWPYSNPVLQVGKQTS